MDLANFFWCFIILVLIVILVIRLLKPAMWTADGPVMRGKLVIITGANCGIGLETAAELARYGAKVIMACRDQAKANEARQIIIDRLRDQENCSDVSDRLVIESLDLSSFDSIRAFASRMLTLPRIDVLINNAGVVFLDERKLTKDGLEMTMGTNHLGHFLLTNLLLPLLKKSAPSRIIVVSSDVYKFGTIDFDNLNSEKHYQRFRAYANSKLANILFARELARQLDGSGVIVNSLHPGMVRTNAGRHLRKIDLAIGIFFALFTRNSLEGAQTSLYLAASQSPEVLKSGAYFTDCREAKLKSHACDDVVAKKLWEVSERITKLV